MTITKFNIIITIIERANIDIKEPRALEIALKLKELSL